MNAIRRATNAFLNFMGDLAEEIADLPSAARGRPHHHITVQFDWSFVRAAMHDLERRAERNALFAVAGWGLLGIAAMAEILGRAL